MSKILKRMLSTKYIAKNAKIGDISIIPIGGIILLNGAKKNSAN